MLQVVLDNPSSVETIVQMCNQVRHEVVERKTRRR